MLGAYASEQHYKVHLEALLPTLRESVEVVARWNEQRPVEAPLTIVASRKDAIRMKDRKVVLIEHGAGQWYGGDPGGPEYPHENVILFLAPRPEVAERTQVLYPNAARVPVGSPFVEMLRSRERKPERVVLAWHDSANVSPEFRSAFPHYRSGLKALAEKVSVLGHGHPRMRSSLRPKYQGAGIPVEWDWPRALSRAVAVSADNTSALWEAVACDVPVIVLDAPWYRPEINYFPRFWEWADVGPRIQQPGQWADACLEAVEWAPRWAEARRAATEAIYGQVDGSIGRAAMAILEVL